VKFNDRPAAADERLSELLCFTIYSANLAFGKVYRPVLDELELTYPQYITIIALWEESPQTVGGLSKKLFLESSTLTPLLKRLESMGFLKRQRDSDDERQLLVGLTQSGRKLREKALAIDLVEATGLAHGELMEVQKALATLRNNLDEVRRLTQIARR
jgi:DNA-binding MarR family transcriptional regulator